LIKKEKEAMEEIHSYEQKVASNSGNSYIGRRSYRCIEHNNCIPQTLLSMGWLPSQEKMQSQMPAVAKVRHETCFSQPKKNVYRTATNHKSSQ
jgi:hypothetical protein